MSEFRLGSLPHRRPQLDNLLVRSHQLAIAADVLVLLNLLQTLVEDKHIAICLRQVALQLNLRLVVLARIERTDVPRQPRTHQSVQAPLAAHHVFEHVQPGITIEPLGKHAQLGQQCGIKRLLLSVSQMQLGVKESHLRTQSTCRLRQSVSTKRLRRRCHLHPAKHREHRLQHSSLRLQARPLLRDIQAFRLHVLQVALGSRATFHHRRQLPLTTAQQLLQVAVQLNLVIEQQQGEIHLVHATAHLIDAHLRLRCLHLALLAGDSLPPADGATVENRLAHIHAHPILVFRQAFHVDAHLLIHRPHLVGKRRHIALQRGLCRSRHLWQPSLPDVCHRQLRQLPHEVALPYERIVPLCRLLTLLQRLRLPANGKQQQHRHKIKSMSHHYLISKLSISK